MTPQGPAHSALTVRVRRRLTAAFGERAHVRDHSNLRLDDRNLPEPDIAVIRGDELDYYEHLPNGADVLIVVEVAVRSHDRDRRKASLYSRAGIPEYWLLDVPGRSLTVHRRPGPAGYAETTKLGDEQHVDVPGAAASVPVADLLAPER